MNDLSYISSLSDAAILKEVGKFVKVKRLEQNLRQEDVAERAAISRSTFSLLERGDNITLSNLLKVLRILESLYVLDQFQIIESISPIKLAKEDEKRRKRASRNNLQDHKDNPQW